MTTTKNDVVSLAKKTSTKKTVAKSVTKKTTAKKSAAEERDLKAKKTVEKLLEDSPINTLDKKEELLEFDEPTQEPKGIEWLEEQVTLLTQKNEAINYELEVIQLENQQLRQDAGLSIGDGDVKKIVIKLFNELQENYVKMGIDKQGMGNFRIYTPGFLNRMIKFFPFLEKVKRY